MKKTVVIICIKVQVRQDTLQIYYIPLSKKPSVCAYFFSFCAYLFSTWYMMERVEEVVLPKWCKSLNPYFRWVRFSTTLSAPCWSTDKRTWAEKEDSLLRCIEGKDQAWILWLPMLSLGPEKQCGHEDSTRSRGQESSALWTHRHNS